MPARAFRYLPQPGTLASTVLILLSVPPVHWSFLIWVAFVPWFVSLRACNSLSGALVQSLWLNVLLGFGGAFWVAIGAERYLSVSASTGVLVLLIHALVHQAQLVVFGGIYWKALRAAAPRTLFDLLALACLYAGLDWVTPKLFQDSLGMVLYAHPVLRQLAAFGGVPLLTFVVALGNLGTYSFIVELLATLRDAGETLSRLAGPTLRLAIPLAGFYAVGAIQQAATVEALEAATRRVRVGVVQGNIDDVLRKRVAAADPDAARASLERYVRATLRLLDSAEPPELVVWPETSYPGVFRKPESDAQLKLNVAFDRFVADVGVAITFGAYDRGEGTERRVLKNALYLVTPSKGQPLDQLSPMQVYHKNILFPVGEYFPLFDEATVKHWLPNSTHLASGEGAALLELQASSAGAVQLGPSICYEDVFPRHARSLAGLGAELLVNISNDSWFGDYGAASWHLMAATLRSIETGLPQVRATNSGYSAFILPTGELHEITPFDEAAERSFELPIVGKRSTLSTRFGSWFGLLASVFAAVWLFMRRLFPK